MSNEKMAILKMLEDGKITADSAAKLLAALGEEGDTAAKTAGESKSHSAGEERSHSTGSSQSQGAAGNGGSPKTPADAKKWLQDISKKIDVVAKDLEPQIQKYAEKIIDKSVELADMASKSIKGSREYRESTRATPEASRKPTGGEGGTSFELPVSEEKNNELILKSPKGSINIRGYNGDKATLRINGVRKTGGKAIEFLQFGSIYQINYDETAYESLNIEAYIPGERFSSLYIETSSGNVDIDNLTAGKITVNTSKCHIQAKNIESDNFKIDNVDGEVLISNSRGRQLVIENANAGAEAVNADFETLKIETTAEPVKVVSQGFYKYRDYNWQVRTSNARLKASLPIASDTAYYLKAFTSLADVSNGLSGISYAKNERNFIEGKSEGYESAAKKVRIELETSNAPLSIN